MTFIRTNNLKKIYGSNSASVVAITDISIDIDAGEFLAVMGESGSGKSTLLSILGAMNTPTTGRYLVDDIDVYQLRPEKQADFRREYLGFIFQSFHLVPYLTAAENTMLPLTTIKAPRKEKMEAALSALDRVGMKNKADRLPNQLSGGEKERVAIARAVVNRPPVILADEPTGNLDTRNSKEVMHLLKELNSAGVTIVMVTHSADCASHADRVVTISDGTIARDRTRKPCKSFKSVKCGPGSPDSGIL